MWPTSRGQSLNLNPNNDYIRFQTTSQMISAIISDTEEQLKIYGSIKEYRGCMLNALLDDLWLLGSRSQTAKPVPWLAAWLTEQADWTPAARQLQHVTISYTDSSKLPDFEELKI